MGSVSVETHTYNGDYWGANTVTFFSSSVYHIPICCSTEFFRAGFHLLKLLESVWQITDASVYKQ